jgi:hypothetical protein
LGAGGILAALGAMALLVDKRYPGIWEDLSRARIEQVASLVAIGVSLTVIIVLLAIGGAALEWTGFGGKTLWDWLQLLSTLAIPIVLAAAGFWFTMQQDTRQRELEEKRAQDETLQAYLDQMSSLMIGQPGQTSLRASKENSEIRTLARARTLTVLQRLDPLRRRTVMQFLMEASLVQSVDERVPIIALAGADLSGTYLGGVA